MKHLYFNQLMYDKNTHTITAIETDMGDDEFVTMQSVHTYEIRYFKFVKRIDVHTLLYKNAHMDVFLQILTQ